MSSIKNEVHFIGRFAGDPELKQTATGISVTNFTLAVDRPGTHGENKKTDWIEFVAFRGAAEFICRNFTKGSPVGISGILTSREWEKDGQKRKTLEVVAESIEFLPRSKENHIVQEDVKIPIPEIQAPAISFGADEDFEPVSDEDLPF